MNTATSTPTPTARALVVQKHPSAFVYDDGESVDINVMRSETVRCETCGQKHTHQVVDLMRSPIGSGGTENAAWESAAETLRPRQSE